MIDVVEPELVKVGCLEGSGMRVTEVDKRVAPVGDERDWVLNYEIMANYGKELNTCTYRKLFPVAEWLSIFLGSTYKRFEISNAKNGVHSSLLFKLPFTLVSWGLPPIFTWLGKF